MQRREGMCCRRPDPKACAVADLTPYNGAMISWRAHGGWVAALVAASALVWYAEGVRPPEVRAHGLPDSATVCPPLGQEPLPPDGYPCWFSHGTWAWRLRETLSHYDSIVVNVTLPDVDHTRDVAAAIVRAYPDAYREILLYAYENDLPETLALRRVQWTPEHGYVTLELGPRPPVPGQ